MAQYKKISTSSFSPLTIEEAKDHLRVIGTFDDSTITALIMAACANVQDYTWRPLVQQTWDLYLDYEEVSNTIMINKAPLISVESVKYYNQNNELTTLDASNYQVDLVGDPGRVVIKTMPQINNVINAMVIRFTCGYCAIGEVVTATSVSDASDVITKTAHGLVNGDSILINDFENMTHLSLDRLYYVVNRTADTFQISTIPNGSHVNLGGSDNPAISYMHVTALPTPIKQALKLIIGHLFEHREDVVVGASVVTLDSNSKWLLEPYVNKIISR